MLLAVPRGILSWDFTIFRDGRAIVDIDMSWWQERAEFTIDGQAYSVYRESMMRGTFVLQSRDHVLARAQKAFTRAFDLDLAGRRIEVKALSFWTRAFGVFENNRQIGSIEPTRWLGRKATINLPKDIEMPAQAFIFWLVLILWRREASSQS